jgi:hypothetical protein
MTKRILITICSKNPKMELIRNIINLNKIFNNYKKKICIIDSDSKDLTIYNEIDKKYPLIDIHYIKNKNFEYGAYKYSYFKYPDYDIYCCIQDTFILFKNIDISKINDHTAFTYFHTSGFYSDPTIKSLGIKLLKNVKLNYKEIIDTRFVLATHSSFIVTNCTIKNIFETLINPPTNKEGSKCYERLFGLFFIMKNIKTISINRSVVKVHGKRK